MDKEGKIGLIDAENTQTSIWRCINGTVWVWLIVSLLRCWLLGDWLNAHSKDAGLGITTLPYFLFLCAHNFPLKACLACADCLTPSATVENYSRGGSRVSGNTVGVVPRSPPSPGSVHCRGKESMSLFLYRLAWKLNFTLSQSSHRLLIERHSHTFPTGYPEILKLP